MPKKLGHLFGKYHVLFFYVLHIVQTVLKNQYSTILFVMCDFNFCAEYKICVAIWLMCQSKVTVLQVYAKSLDSIIVPTDKQCINSNYCDVSLALQFQKHSQHVYVCDMNVYVEFCIIFIHSFDLPSLYPTWSTQAVPS